MAKDVHVADMDGDGDIYLRSLMHADGNIRYANYQSEAQMNDYLTAQEHESVLAEII